MKKLVLALLFFVGGCGLVQIVEEQQREEMEYKKWMQHCLEQSHELVEGMSLSEVERALCMPDGFLVRVRSGSRTELYETPDEYNSSRLSYSLDAQNDSRRWNRDFGYVYGIKSGSFWFGNGRLTYWSFHYGY